MTNTYVFFEDSSGEYLNIVAPDLDAAYRRLNDYAGGNSYLASQWALRETQKNAPQMSDEEFIRKTTNKNITKAPKKSQLRKGVTTGSFNKRSKWIGNMFKSSNKRLSQITRSGTTKQKALARKILNSRKK